MIPGESEPDDPGVLETDVLGVGRAIDNATPDRWQLELRALSQKVRIILYLVDNEKSHALK